MNAAGRRVRVLVTGSRDWTDTATVTAALRTVWGTGQVVLVHGGCPSGADAIADEVWRSWGGTVEVHPADWARHGRSAGFIRNRAMVATCPRGTVCLAFIRNGSAGASHTAHRAARAGLDVRRYPAPPLPARAGVVAWADDRDPHVADVLCVRCLEVAAYPDAFGYPVREAQAHLTVCVVCGDTPGDPDTDPDATPALLFGDADIDQGGAR